MVQPKQKRTPLIPAEAKAVGTNKSISSGFENQRLGKHGENLLQTLCNDGNLVANRSQDDLLGWDFLVEFREAERVSTTDLDLVPAELSCKIQVKTIQPGQRVRINLGNWERMAKEPIPWFVIVVLAEKNSEGGLSSTGAFVVHVWTDWIGRTLKRLRSSKSRARLHKSTMDLTWNDGDSLDPKDGSALRRTLRAAIGNQLDYVIRKMEQVHSAGNQSARGSFNVNKPGDCSAADLVAKFAVGIVNELPISSFRAERVRFGIATPSISADSAIMRLGSVPSIGDTAITATAPDGSQAAVVFETHVASSLFPFLPSESNIVRFAHPLITLDVWPHAARMVLSFNFGEGASRHRLSECGPVGRFLRILAKTDESRPSLRFGFHFSQRIWDLSAKNYSLAELPPKVLALAEGYADAWLAIQQFGLDCEASCNEIMAAKGALSILRYAQVGGDLRISLSVALADAGGIAGATVTIVQIIGARLGAVIVLFALAAEGAAEIIGTESPGVRVEVVQPAIRIIGSALAQKSVDCNSKILMLIEEAVALLAKEGVENVIAPEPESLSLDCPV